MIIKVAIMLALVLFWVWSSLRLKNSGKALLAAMERMKAEKEESRGKEPHCVYLVHEWDRDTWLGGLGCMLYMHSWKTYKHSDGYYFMMTRTCPTCGRQEIKMVNFPNGNNRWHEMHSYFEENPLEKERLNKMVTKEEEF